MAQAGGYVLVFGGARGDGDVCEATGRYVDEVAERGEDLERCGEAQASGHSERMDVEVLAGSGEEIRVG